MTHPKDRCQAYQTACFNCNRLGHFSSMCRSTSSSGATQNSRQFNRFCGRGRASEVEVLPRRQVNDATEISEAKSNDKSDLDIVRLMEAYGLSNNSPKTSLKQRVQIDDIITVGVQDIGFENIVNATTKEFTMPVPVLHRVPTEYNTCTEWEAVDKLELIPSYIGQQCIQMEANIPTDWNIDALMPKTIHLIEIDSVASDCFVHMLLSTMKFVILS